jgi:NAD-dependent dihydropyrimidine dehydrogenase PreA subunit
MCGLCKEVCPQEAIVGEEYLPYLADNEPYYININKCDNCGLCLPVCEANAIELI